jgi:ATP-dependent helicase HrpA
VVLPVEARAPYLELPNHVSVRGREVEIDYDVEPGPVGVARLRLPEKMARTLVEEELPVLDRPVRFTVLRGQRGTVRAATLDELQDLLDRPWAPPPRPRADDRRQPKDGRRNGKGRRRRR